MKLFLKNIKWNKRLLIGILLVILFIIIKIYFRDFFVNFLWNTLTEPYLNFAERIVVLILHLFDSSFIIDNHTILYDSSSLFELGNGIVQKSWGIFLLIVIWVTRSTIKQKSIFSAFLLLLHFFFTVIGILLATKLASIKTLDFVIIQIASTPCNIMMITLLLLWYRRNKEFFLLQHKYVKISKETFEYIINTIFIVLFVKTILNDFLYNYFEFFSWRELLFVISDWFLNTVTSYSSVLEIKGEDILLIGNSATLLLGKPCLGYKTFVLFASIVFITGKSFKKRIIYILTGFLLINILNIIRLIELFIHIQKYGRYVFSIDLHDLFNYVLYVFIFIMWVIWFEKYSDIWPLLKKERKQENDNKPVNTDRSD